ncbi:MAG: tRNA dihydrouridine(20/20a) synthase DusA [Hydrogenovibrio sp.]|nr:tRNA dihydrouridine(20/20a) synthase DusA [Hydrogenovibrio sp.]
MNFNSKTSNNPNSSPNFENSAQGFSVAPMLDWTDRHCRVFHRKLTRHAWLYSEMVTTGAIIYGENLPRFLGHDPSDAPVVLQLGGADPVDLAKSARLGQEWGYNEINLNVGCPSDRVQNNMIGACLMNHPKVVAEAVAAMKAVVSIPVTVKSRIGLDDSDDYQALHDFVSGIERAGGDGVIIHARNAWLQGLSPKENREVPPLKYDWVRRIKQDFPHLPVAINGGIKTPEQGLSFLQPEESLPGVDGVMLGRAAYENPYLLTSVDSLYYHDAQTPPEREAVLESMYPYIEAHLASGGKLNQVSRHMLGLFAGMPGGRMWRRYISENAFQKGAGIEVLQTALTMVQTEMKRMEDRQ